MTVPIVALRVACPSVLKPQQAAVPLLLMAQVWESPAAIEVMVPRPAGMVVCPLVLRPQQAAVPSLLMAHEWEPPAVIALRGSRRWGGLPVRVVAPAGEGAIALDPAGVRAASADRAEGAGRRGGLAGDVVAPAGGGADALD